MTIFKKLLDFYIKSSLHVGFAMTCLVWITVFPNDFGQHIAYPVCVFFGTVLGYNLLKYHDAIFVKPKFIKKHLGIFVVSLIAFLEFCFFFLLLRKTLQVHLFAVGILVILYPFLRKYGLLKIFLVSFCIALVTVYIPFLTQEPTQLDLYITLLQRFIFVVSWIIPFEILDSKTDAASLNTFPQKFGIITTKLFGMFLVIPFMVMEFLKSNYSYTVLPIGIITVLFIHFASVKRSKYYTTFWAESIPIVWYFLLLIHQMLICR